MLFSLSRLAKVELEEKKEGRCKRIYFVQYHRGWGRLKTWPLDRHVTALSTRIWYPLLGLQTISWLTAALDQFWRRGWSNEGTNDYFCADLLPALPLARAKWNFWSQLQLHCLLQLLRTGEGSQFLPWGERGDPKSDTKKLEWNGAPG